MEAEGKLKYIEEYYDKLKELQKNDKFLETIEIVEEMGK